jgi:hypothetical protein
MLNAARSSGQLERLVRLKLQLVNFTRIKSTKLCNNFIDFNFSDTGGALL